MLQLGKVLLSLVLRNLKVDCNRYKDKAEPCMIPAFYHIYKRQMSWRRETLNLLVCTSTSNSYVFNRDLSNVIVQYVYDLVSHCIILLCYFYFKPHPTVVRLFQEGRSNDITVMSCDMPFVVPPVPWSNCRQGIVTHYFGK